jgi:hypothetical protein
MYMHNNFAHELLGNFPTQCLFPHLLTLYGISNGLYMSGEFK